MNKLKYSLIALATLFVACDNDDYTDWAAPQSNEPEELASASFSATEVSTIVMADLTADDVQIFTPSTQIEDGATDVNYKVVLSTDDNSVEISASEDGYVSVSDLQSAVETLYGKAPETRDITTTIYCYFTLNGTVYRCAGSANITVSVLLEAPFIEDTYYLIGDIEETNGNWEIPIKFNHSDSNVYDDPIFTVTFTTYTGKEGEWYFKFPGESVLGSDGKVDWSLDANMLVVANADDREVTDGSTVNLALQGEVGDQSLYVTEEGKYRVTLNMMDYTATIEKLGDFEDFIYVPGDLNWTVEEGKTQRLACTDNDGNYTGFAVASTEFKFAANPSWSPEYGYSYFNTFTGVTLENNSSNIKITDATGDVKMYYMNADCANKTLNVLDGSTISLIGKIVGDNSGWSVPFPMELKSETVDEVTEYYLTANITVEADNEFKFYGGTNAGWNIDLGGSFEDLTWGGGNLTISNAGTYTINLYPTRVTKENIYCTVTLVTQ